MTTPTHYMGDGIITCKDAMRSMMSGDLQLYDDAIFWWGCIFKYIWRWPYKGVKNDLLKARECIDILIECMSGGDDS